MNDSDQLLFDKLKRAIAELNKCLAELDSMRDAIITEMLSLAQTVAAIEKVIKNLKDKDNCNPANQYWRL